MIRQPAPISSLHGTFLSFFQFIAFIQRLLCSTKTLAVLMIAARFIRARNVPRLPLCFVVQKSQRRFLSALNLLQLAIPTSKDMEDVGAILSIGTGPGDVILLGGDLGAGKTCFSRGFVRARTGNMDQRVTSPTYLLSNTYDAGDVLYETKQQTTLCCYLVSS